jgi:lysine 2,3-aminomutase
VRNLTVLLRGVNSDAETQSALIRRLSLLNVRPYYTYMGDMVHGTEDLRTAVWEAMHMEKLVRGVTSGHNMPTYVLDAPGGGGKRNLYSFEYYDRQSGISIYSAPSVKPGELFMYGDPLHYMSHDMRRRWRHADSRREMLEDALATARRNLAV